MTNPLFKVHRLNDMGMKRAAAIADSFSELATALDTLGALDGREGAIVKTKLEEACFFAKKAMAVKLDNHDDGAPPPAPTPKVR